MRLSAARIGAYPAEVPDPTVSQRLSVAKLVNSEPSPWKLVAVTIPTTFTLPIACSLYPFAVVPIPTPVQSTENRDDAKQT